MSSDRLALGIDAGGTETRWALANGWGEIVGEGQVAGFSALQARGLELPHVVARLADLAKQVLAVGQPLRAHAALTGFDGEGELLRTLVAAPLGLPNEAVTIGSDIEATYLDLFAPGEGYVVYSGTGSIAAFVDAAGELHRVGGHGVTVDDAGGGFWIARRALRAVWRAEEENPGASRLSPLAIEIFDAIGGSDWSHTRRYVYEGTRGDVGRLALAVARAADRDTVASGILREAGAQLARLARVMVARHGPRPVALTGRAAGLHPIVAQAMREGVPAGTELELRSCRAHHAAAHLALRRIAT